MKQFIVGLCLFACFYAHYVATESEQVLSNIRVESATIVDGHEMTILLDTTTGVRYLSYRSCLTQFK